jgi:hypothetical protein
VNKTTVSLLAGTCLLLTVATLMLSAASAVEPNKTGDGAVAREIPLCSPRGSYDLGVSKPLVITSAAELRKALPDQAQVGKQVDFAREQCLFFAWKGSGGDRLSFTVEQGKAGPVVVFRYSPGLTDDLRPHAHLYAIPETASWHFEDLK